MNNRKTDETSEIGSRRYRDREQTGMGTGMGNARTSTEVPGQGEQNPRGASVPPPPDDDDSVET